MRAVNRCPACGSVALKSIHKRTFVSPAVPADEAVFQERLMDIVFERLYILFHYLMPGELEATFEVDICKNCGLLFLNPRLTEEKVALKYKAIDQIGSVKLREKRRPATRLNQRAEKVFEWVRSCLKEKKKMKGMKILDYGGASGYLLVPFLRNNNRCYLIDYERWELPPGVEYLGHTLSEVPEGTKFDLILCCHVLEHLIEPKSTIETLSSLLSPLGLLYVEVPLGCFQEYKRIQDPITHINFFGCGSLRYIMAKCGLEIIRLDAGLRWVTHGRMLCLRALAEKKTGTVNLPRHTYRAVQREMHSPYLWFLSLSRRLLDVIF